MSVKIPKFVIDAAKSAEKRAVQKVGKEKKDRKDLDRKTKKILKNRVRHGIIYAKRIFFWAEEVLREDVGMAKLIRTGYQTKHVPGIYFFFSNRTGLGLSEKGVWYKHFGCFAGEHFVSDAKELAKNVDTEVLKEAWESIENGMVWLEIKKYLDRWQ